MRIPLTARQRRVYEFIAEYIAACGYGPTIREIGEGLAIGSPNGVACHLTPLQRKGWIDWQPGLARSIAITAKRGIPVLTEAMLRAATQDGSFWTDHIDG